MISFFLGCTSDNHSVQQDKKSHDTIKTLSKTIDSLKSLTRPLNLCIDYYNVGLLELPFSTSFFFNTSIVENVLDVESLNSICNAHYIHIKSLDNVKCDVDYDSNEYNDFNLFQKDFCKLNVERYRVTKLVSGNKSEKQNFFTYLIFTTKSNNLYLMTAKLLDQKEKCIQIKDVVTLSYSCCGVYKGRNAVFINSTTIDISEGCQSGKNWKEGKCTVKVDSKSGAINVIYK